MSLSVRSKETHFHPGSGNFFAIVTEEHPQGAWVIARDPEKQATYYQTAYDAANDTTIGGEPWYNPIIVECDRYEDSGENRRYYLDVTNVRKSGISLRGPELRNLPPLNMVIKKTSSSAGNVGTKDKANAC